MLTSDGGIWHYLQEWLHPFLQSAKLRSKCSGTMQNTHKHAVARSATVQLAQYQTASTA